MTTGELVRWLTEKGISLKVTGDRLVVRSQPGTLTDEIRALLREHKSELLDELAAPAGQDAPLSFGQQQLWLLDQLPGGGVAYNVTAVLHVTGALEPAALERAFTELVRRNEVLRTCFTEHEGVPVQRVIEDFAVPVRVVGARDVREVATESALRRFDLTRDVLVRLTLVRHDEDEHDLVITMHHIAGDALSMGLLFGELAELYSAFAAGEPSPLPEPGVQYRDFARWQQDRFARTDPAELEFWREYLRGAPVEIDLPADRPRPAERSFAGGTIRFTVPADVAAGLKQLAGRYGATLFMALLAVLKTLLARHSGQRDVVVGIPMANRQHRSFRDAIGFFVTTLAIRTDVTGDPSFEEFLRRVRDAALAAFAHGDVPFEHVVRAVQGSGSSSRLPVYQVMFGLQTGDPGRIELPGCKVEELPFDPPTAKHDLTVLIDDVPGGLAVRLEYNGDIFEPATARRLAVHFAELCSAIVADPGRPLSRLPMTDAVERADLALFRGAQRIDITDSRGESVAVGVPGDLVVVDDHGRRPLGRRARWRADGRLDLLDGGGYEVHGVRAQPVHEAPAALGDDVEQIVTQVWAKVLGVDDPSPSDDFFALGGSSMAAMQVNWELRKLLGVEIPMTEVFENPTVSGLAALVRAASGGGSGSGWRREELPAGGPGHLWNVAALGADDVWAAGQSDAGSVVLHRDGHSWTAVDHPELRRVVGIAAAAADDVWLSGRAGLLHWDGSRWKRAADFDCASVIATGGMVRTLLRPATADEPLSVASWDGTEWQHRAVPLTLPAETLHGCLSAAGPDEFWVSTMRSLGDGTTESVVLRWDGDWSTVDLPADAEVIRVAALAADDVWVLGARASASLALRWDGGKWTDTTEGSGLSGRINSIVRAGDAWYAAGGGDGDPGRLLRWTGDRWTELAAPRSLLLGDLVRLPGTGEFVAGGAADDGMAVFRGCLP
ncbi:condensation domain-containing protein [Amycolatopsis sp. NPDC049159]|uniref:condensation domain-containing protein n=1 Tax=Amycolatopsis sp. NPDC049159 TaxID=3157210 RepID=UPI0033EDC2FF